MSEESTIRSLTKYAELRGIKFYTNSNTEMLNLTKVFMSSKFVVFDLSDGDQKLYFVFFDSFASHAFTSKTFSGFFKETKKNPCEFSILKRDWFDIFSFKRRVKSGSSFVDKNVIIYGSNKVDSSIVNSGSIGQFLNISKKIKPLEFSVVENTLEFIPELKTDKLVALTSNWWISDSKNLDFFIEEGQKLFQKI